MPGNLQRVLDLVVNVRSVGVGKLNEYQRALLALANSQVAAEKQARRYGNALSVANAVINKVIPSIQDETRRIIESNRATRTQTQLLQANAQQRARNRAASAALAAASGNLDLAERRLNGALRIQNLSYTEAARIRTQLVAIQRRRAQEAARERATATAAALAEARLARAVRDTAKEIDILRRATQLANITDQQRLRLRTALAQAERRLAADQARAAARAGGGTTAGTTVSGVYNTITRLTASLVLFGFVARTVARTIDRFIFQPLVETARAVLSITDEFRRLDASLVGVVGSMRGVRDLTRDIARSTRDLPVGLLDAIGGIRGLAFTPGTAELIRTPGPGRVEGLAGISRILTGLATIDPEQGIPGARFAVREALAGEFRSLRFRFEVSPDVIAATIGKQLSDLKADPSLTLKALETFVNLFVGDEAFNQFNRLLSVQGRRFKDALQQFANLIGDQGIYDRITGVVRGLADAISLGVQERSPEVVRAAQTINQALMKALSSVLLASSTAASSITGQRIDFQGIIDSQDVGEMAKAVSAIIEQLTKLASMLVLATPILVSALFKLAGGPQSIEGIDRRIASLERVESNLTSPRDPNDIDLIPRVVRFFRGRSPGSATLPESLERSLLQTRLELADLRARRAIFTASSPAAKENVDAFDPVRDFTSESIKRIEGFGGTLRQSLASLPEFDPEVATTLSDQLKLLFDKSKTLFDTSDPKSFASRIKEINERIDKERRARVSEISPRFQAAFTGIGFDGQPLGASARLAQSVQGTRDLFGYQAQYLNDLATLRGLEKARDASLSGFREESLKRLLGIINGSEGLTTQLPSSFRAGQGLDILELVSGRNLRSGLGISAIGPGVQAQNTKQLVDQLGFTQNDLLRPESASTIANQIESIATAMANLGETEAKTSSVTANLADVFIEEYGKIKETVKDPAVIESFDIAIARMEDLKRKAQETADPIKEVFRDLAQDVSSSLRTGLVDAIIDSFEEGARNVREIAANLLRAIQRSVIQTAVELSVIRTLINPALNSSFGLEGANQLPVLGAKGMITAGTTPVPFQRGSPFVTGPELFPMSGGRTGLRGEAGVEGLMPLTQMADGSLGVRADGGGGGRVVNIGPVHIHAENPNAFRKSTRQMADTFRRAVGG